ncbi:hypothetical protein [Microtetraspora malaysiensis]|uniref:hypothetical protein n=1 Tax=Microtetraspora malaysiensis TaxID=161358 RepID=UPI00082F82E0|nr:hypothetical protein [Microtetraspora malaysiensis]
MTDSSSGSGIPSAADLMGGSSLMGHQELQFPEKGEVASLGSKLAERAPALGKISQATGSIEIGFPGFGAVGIGLASAHDSARKAAASALEEAQKALASWEKALKDMDDNYDRTNPDDKKKGSDTPDPKVPGTPKIPGTPDPKMPDVPNPDDLGKGPKVPNPDDLGKGPDVPNPDDLGKGPKAPNPDDLGKGPKAPNPDDLGKGPNVPNPDDLGKGPGTDLPSHDTTGITTPSIGDPSTNLAGLDPNRVTIPGGQNPGGQYPGGSGWPGSGPGGTTTGGPGYSGTAPGAGLGRTAADAARAAGAGGTGMPYMPPMGGGGGGGAQEREREKSAFLTGDEGDWGADDDVAPAVIGQID